MSRTNSNHTGSPKGPLFHQALLLVVAEEVSYGEAARICGTNIGTIKSRVNRARTHLAELLTLDPEEDLGPDRLIQAALSARSP